VARGLPNKSARNAVHNRRMSQAEVSKACQQTAEANRALPTFKITPQERNPRNCSMRVFFIIFAMASADDRDQEEVPMKFCKVSIFLALLLAVCLPVVAQAQMQVNVPFSFSAAAKSLPAGQYRVSQISSGDQALWLVSGYHDGAMMLTNPVVSRKKAHRPSLTFWCEGKSCSLVQIWLTENYGRELRLKSNVKSTVLAEASTPVENGKYVEIAGE